MEAMRARDIIFIAIGVICLAVFAWSLTTICSRPTIAHAANWLSTVAFALLGPVWASQGPSNAIGKRMIYGFATVVIGFFGALIAPPFEFACH
jgi:hypothetical protein